MTARDHGGDLGTAIRRYGGAEADWIDLSTGINRRPWPAPPLAPRLLHVLPRAEDFATAAVAALQAYGAGEGVACLPMAGAQAAIQLVPRLAAPGRAAVLGPTYNEHAAAFRAAAWPVHETTDLAALEGADAAVVVNPNNPDGRRHPPEALAALAGRVGLLVVDESFADATPELSLCPQLGRPGRIVLRSLGKFYGLAGLRLGFALGAPRDIARLAALAGPWAVSGPALGLGAAALADAAWAEATRARLPADAARLDALAAARWTFLGGTGLFRTYDAGDAAAAQARLARARIWTRTFPYSSAWIRLGLPAAPSEWDRLQAALA